MTGTTRYLRSLLLAVALGTGFSIVAFPPPICAQTSLGTLTGVVRDPSGAVVTGAHVSASNVATGDVRTTTTSALGAYRFDALTPGQYILHVESTGFEKFDAKNITVLPSQAASFDPSLKPGHVDETVAVSADAVLLNQENASLSSTINSEEMQKLPIFTLNPVEVLTTVPGVQVVSNSNMSNGESIQVSGARPRSNNFMIDGQEMNDATIGGQAVQPNIPDMYADTVIYTHNAPAEFGRASGGVVNLITKGGTNTFHGDAWELYSGSGLNAMDGQTRQVTPKVRSNKERYDQHQYGFTAGGPIIKNKLFAFGAAQWSRYYGNENPWAVYLPDANGIALLQSLAAGSGTVAAQAQLLLPYLNNGSYLNSYLQYTDPTQGCNGSESAPSCSNIGAAMPASLASQYPNGMEVGLFQRPPTPASSPDTQWTYRIDFTPTNRDTFTARYLHDRSSLSPDFFTNGASLPGFDTYQGGPSELGQGAWTHIFTTNLLNEFRVAETRISFYFSPAADTLANPLYTAPQIAMTEISELGFNQSFPQGRSQDMYQFQDTISWTHGRHTVRAGADIGRRIETDLNALNLHGTLSFNDGGSGSSSIGNFLLNQLGPSGAATRTAGDPRVDPHSWRSGIFAQDDIKLTPDFTANLGIRWDYFTNPDNSLPYPAIDPSTADTLYGPILTVYKVSDDKHSFGPRVGFAYTPHNGTWFGDGKTVIRAGFGIFFDSEFTNITINTAASAPNVASETFEATTGNGMSGATGLIANTPTVGDHSSVTNSVVKNLTTPYTPEWNLTIERELPGRIAINATYAGARGTKLFANQQYNYYDFDTGERLNPNRDVINARGNFADSEYNGLEIGVRRDFSKDLMVTGSYVYSKTLDDGSEVFTTDSSPTSYSANLAPGARSKEWGNSAYDHRHYAAINYVWTPRGLHASNRGMDTFLSGATRHWTISGTSRFQSGSYATVNMYGLDLNGDGSAGNDRPLVGNRHAAMNTAGIDGSLLGADTGTYYDLAAANASGALNPVNPNNVRWLIPAPGTSFVNREIGRNSYQTPGLLYNDVALEKDLPSSWLHMERGRFVLRAEAQNIANHNNVNLTTAQGGASSAAGAGIETNLNLLNVGTPSFLNTSQARESDYRAIRFWAKYVF